MADDKPRRVCRPRAATNKWDAEQRTALHVLCTHFNSFGWPLVTKAFNVLFEEHLSSRGFPDGLLEGSLKAQYAKSERNGKPQIWASICAQPATDEEWHRRIELTARIRTVLTALQTGAQNQPAVPRLGETATGAGRRQPATESPPDEPKTPLKRLSRFMLAESMVKRRKTDSGATSGSAMPRPADRPAQTAPASFVAEPPSTGRATSSVTSGTNTNIRVAVSVKIVANGKGAAHSQPAEPVTPPSTRSRKTPRSEQRLQDHTRRNALTLKLTDEEIARTKLPLVPVPQGLAHPPSPGLLYRYWDENSYGRNSETGFVAGRFMYNNLFPRTAPKCHELDDTDIENHLNRNKVASPFCSASNCLLWIVRLGLQEARRGVKQGRIALIDTDSLPADGVYHVKPLHKRIKPQFPFTNGAWRYDGTHELYVLPSSKHAG
ncbi:hypothetical protein B0A55_01554 [Friedmanniomyces simplex]|uniref:DUF7587 domain-containing protein n=1 Tax=Friedmanniomyces simplex TaxID=329884 RepID=A0A4U0Y0V3_9PEZI|nr:hypothetical protein B0A55_01554 [Friedmanniomyces simplex]